MLSVHNKVYHPQQSTSVDPSVTITFHWRGERRHWWGLFNIRRIDFVFRNSLPWKIHLPNNLLMHETYELPFICKKYYPNQTFKALQVAIKEFKHLTLRIVFVPACPYPVPPLVVMNPRTGEVFQLQQSSRFFREINLGMLKELDPGQHYRFEILSKDLSFNVRVIKLDESVSDYDRARLVSILSKILSPLMEIQILEFVIKVRAKTKIMISPIFHEYVPSIAEQMDKINSRALRCLMVKVNQLLEQRDNWLTLEQKHERSKKIAKWCFETLTQQGLSNIMKSYLHRMVEQSLQNNLENIKSQIEPLTTQIAHQFVESCIK